ncbi:MAG: sodium-dependent transporter [Sphingomonadales bacterium]
MTQHSAPANPRWSSHLVFVLSAAGAAVGLGNFWRFPFVVGENGGGAFVIVYLAAVALVGFPIMMAELMIGRRGRGNAEQAIGAVSREVGAAKFWRVIGALSVFIPFIGIGYYSVVAGWVLDYMVGYIANFGFHFADPAAYQQRFDDMLASPMRLLLLHLAFMSGVVFVVGLEIQQGIERVAKLMMPGLFLLLLGLVAFAAVKGDFFAGLSFLLKPDFSALTGRAVLMALGQAFFSLAIGIGILMTFGAYLDERASIPKAAAQICIADTSIALLAGLAIFPIVFAFGLEATGGEGLVFVALPAAFAEMTGGAFFGSAFFVLLFFAAFTTGVATLEPVVSWLVGRGVARRRAAVLAGGVAWLLGAAATLSFNEWETVYPLAFLPGWENLTIFAILDTLIASLLLPINGVLLSLFAGWALPRALAAAELDAPAWLLTAWRWLLRVVVPVAILTIMIGG